MSSTLNSITIPLLESQSAKLCQEPGLHPGGLGHHLNKNNINNLICKLDFSFKSYPQKNKQNKLFKNYVNLLICQLIKTKNMSNVVLKSHLSNDKLSHRQIYNMNETASEIKNVFCS